MERSAERATGALLLALVFSPLPALAGDHRVPRIETAFRIDGMLDEEAWKGALKLDVGIEVQPAENVPAPVSTEVLVFHTGNHFLIAFKAHDPDPADIRARLSDRDDVGADDWVGIVLDTFNDGRRSFTFLVNPLGVQSDMIEASSGGGSEWDAIWESAGSVTPDGYQVEIAIPFSSLRFQPTEGEQTWGFDAIRSWPRGVRHLIGLFPRDRSNNCYLCQAEKLVGFSGARPGHDIEFDPTLTAVYSENREGFTDGPFHKRDSDLDPGLTAHWGVTPNMTVVGTANPDFSQVEADVARLDVNRQFTLFYPEKRPFFLEGLDFFQSQITAIHTRTLADPAWGLKLSGKVGGGVIGVFTARDEITNFLFPDSQSSAVGSVDSENQATALRYRQDFGRSSTAGLLVTDREGDDYHNRVGGIDLVLRPTPTDLLQVQLLGSSTAYPEEVVAMYDQPADELRGHALDFMYIHQTREHEYYLRFADVDRDFRSDLGFVPQTGYRYYDAGWLEKWQHDDPEHWYNLLRIWVGYEFTDDRLGNTLRDVAGTFLQYNGPLQSSFFGTLYLGHQTYLGKRYGHDTFEFSASLQPSATLGLGLTGVIGDGVDYANARAGDRLQLSPSATLRLGGHLCLTLNHSWERFDVEPGRLYEANVSELRAVYQFTPRAFARVIVQNVDYRFDPTLYDADPPPERYRHLLSQLLFSYEINPQTALYLGYSDNYNANAGDHLSQTDRTYFVKIGYALRI